VREYFDDQTVQMEVRRGIQFLSEQDAEDVMSVCSQLILYFERN